MIAFWAVTALVIAADLITKQLVVSGMELNSTITVIPGVFDLTYIINRGAAWGVLADKQMLLNVFTVIVIAALVFYAVRKHKSIGRLELVSIAMIIGGGIGNLIGRIIDGYVVDFIHLRFVDFFNIFNIADIGITVGCLLLVISVLFSGRKDRKEKKPAAETQTGSAAEAAAETTTDAAAEAPADYSEIRWDLMDEASDDQVDTADNDSSEGGTVDEENGEQTVNEDAAEGGTVDGR